MKLQQVFLKTTAVFALSTSVAFAFSDGTLGNTSTGTTDVQVIKGDLAQITKLSDIDLGIWTAGGINGTDDACIYTTTGNYNVTATSLNTDGTNFRVNSGANFINYAVAWEDSTAGFTALTHATALNAQTGDNTNTDCGGALAVNANVRVNITNGAMTAAPIGIYTDTLTLVIAPE